VTIRWRKFYCENLHDLSSLQNWDSEIKSNETGGECSMHGEVIGMYKTLVRKHEGMTPFWRREHRWDDKLKMDLTERPCGGELHLINLPQDRD
jgi:hypothetical protein